MLSWNKLGAMLDIDFIPIDLFSKVPLFTVANGTIGASMTLGLDVDTASAEVVGGTGITADRQLLTNGPVGLFSSSSGIPIFEEIGSTGIVGCKMNDDGDAAALFMRVPDKWDFRQKLRFRAIWATDSATAADTVLWEMLYQKIVPDVSALTAPATVLDTLIVVDTAKGTAKTIQASPWGVLNGGTLDRTAPYNEHLGLKVVMKTKAGGLTEDIWALGVEVEHTIRRGRGLKKIARRFVRSQD